MHYKIKLLLFFACTLLFMVQIKSQPIMGFQLGFNASSLSGHKEYDENKLRYGLSAYAFTDIPLGRNSIVSLETGLSISQQGMRHQTTTDAIASTNILTVKNKLNYVVLPIYLKENFNNFYTKIGPYGAYLINVSSTWKNQEMQGTQLIEETEGTDGSFEQNTTPYDLGLSFGFGFIHFFEPGPGYYRRRGRKKTSPVLQVDFRYNMGFVSIDASGVDPSMNWRNRTFTIGLSISSVRN